MPNLIWRTTATDGIFQAGQANLFEFDSTKTELQERQVNEILMPNLTQRSDYVVISSDASDPDGFIPYIQDSTGSWVRIGSDNPFLVDSTKDCWIVIVPDSSLITKVYLCKNASEKDQIPNYTEVPSIEYRIASDITKANYSGWRNWHHTSSGLSGSGIPLAPIRLPVTETYCRFIIAVVDGEKIKLSDTFFSYDGAASDVDQGSLPVVAQYLRKGNQIIYDLDERVTILETQMADIQDKLTSLTSEVNDLNAKVTGILTATSKFFVSR